jgi:hypothetical protein
MESYLAIVEVCFKRAAAVRALRARRYADDDECVFLPPFGQCLD